MQLWLGRDVVTRVVLVAIGASPALLPAAAAVPQVRTDARVDASCPVQSEPSACALYSPFSLDADCCAKPSVAFCAPGFAYHQGAAGCGKGYTGGEVTTCCVAAPQVSLTSQVASAPPLEAVGFEAAPTPPPSPPLAAQPGQVGIAETSYAPAAPPAMSSSADPLADCLEIPRGLCVRSSDGAQNVVLSASKTPNDLVLWYQFDKALPVDDSGNKHHLMDANGKLSQVPTGPGVLGRGGSASFDGHFRRVVRAPATVRTDAFTVALWLYLREDSVGSWRTIFSKGSDPERLAPALLLQPDKRRLHVRVARAGAEGAALDGSGLVPLRRWTHVAVVCSGGVLRLYVNGVKDGEVILENSPTESGGDDVHLGRDPWRAGTKSFLDDFRWYSRALLPAEIKALTLPSITGTGADFVRLGCKSCKYTEAVRSCGSRAHLCSAQELYSGGLHMARVMGWLALSPEVWDLSGSEGDSERFSNTQKLGLCCAN